MKFRNNRVTLIDGLDCTASTKLKYAKLDKDTHVNFIS